MLIVQITQNFFSHGAVMRRARQETIALLNAGHRVIVITDLNGLSAIKELEDFKNKLLIISLKPIFLYRFRNLSSQISFTLKTYYALKKIIKKESIDLIVSHGSIPCYAIALITKKKRIPSAWVIQDLIKDRLATGNPYNWFETLIFLHSNKFAIKNVTYLIPVSRYSKKLLLMDGANPEKIYLKHNVVDTITFSPKEDIIKNIDVLFIGRLSIEKGVDILIDSVDYLVQDITMAIIGDGPIGSKLKFQARNKKKKIIFLGFVEHDKLPKYIRRAKVVVVPSRSECHAAVPLESMACGVPVIASRVAGMEDSIRNNQDGWLLDQNDAKSLGTLINKILSNDEKLKKMGQFALKKSQQFSEANFKIDIVKFYTKLIKSYQLLESKKF